MSGRMMGFSLLWSQRVMLRRMAKMVAPRMVGKRVRLNAGGAKVGRRAGGAARVRVGMGVVDMVVVL